MLHRIARGATQMRRISADRICAPPRHPRSSACYYLKVAMRRSIATAMIIVLLVVTGCSGGPTFAPVTGTLTVGGKPLENVQVEFWPQVSGPRSIGMTDKDGRFTLTSDNGNDQGAVIGSHKVVLVDLAPYAKVPVNMPREVEKVNLASVRFGKQFADPNRTPLQKVVTAGKNTIDLVAGP
jgi:hypothetical protein